MLTATAANRPQASLVLAGRDRAAPGGECIPES
jgi:hypothetical protein